MKFPCPKHTWGIGAGLICLLISSAAGAQDGYPFEPERGYLFNQNPERVASGDFNGDGQLDLAVTLPNKKIRILLNSGAGLFQEGALYTSTFGFQPTDIETADINRDGKLDLLVTNGYLDLFIGNGNGSFQPPVASPGGGQIIKTADLNGDGWVDLVAYNPGLNELQISVYLNHAGVFEFKGKYPSWSYEEDGYIEIADFNNDTRPDMVVPGTNFYLGNGDGSFQSPQEIDVGRYVSSGDFNGDGNQDLVANLQGGTILGMNLGRGDGTFQPRVDYVVGANLFVAADFTGDGKKDLLNSVYRNLELLVGRGDGTFAAELNFSIPYIPNQMIADDFNGDHAIDLVTVRDYVSVLLNKNEGVRTMLSTKVVRPGAFLKVTVLAPKPFSEPPTATLSGGTLTTSTIPLSATGQPDQYSGVYQVPSGTANGKAKATITGTYPGGTAQSVGTEEFVIDAASPEVLASFKGTLSPGGWYTSRVTATLGVTNSTSGLDTIYYGIDAPACAPNAPSNCSVYTGPFTMDQEGAHSLVYFVKDNGGSFTDPQTVIIKINRTVPVADDQSLSLQEDAPLAVTLTATDPGVGDPLTYTVVAAPLHGSLSGTAPNLTYTPARDYAGPDGIAFRASDGQNSGNLATVSLTVNPVNDAPAPRNQTLKTSKNVPLSLRLSAYDPDNGILSYVITSPPSHGTLSGAAPKLTYTPADGYVGSDSFTFKANDGQADGTTGTVAIEIAATPPISTLYYAGRIIRNGTKSTVSTFTRHPFTAEHIVSIDSSRGDTFYQNHTLALMDDGTIWAWGNNANGQLGNGTTADQYVDTPVQVTGLAGVTAVAAGGLHSLALKSDGTVWSWGDNGEGRLGDGTTTDRSVPDQVVGLSGVEQIAAGEISSLALKSDGTVWAWGGNYQGQLGDKTRQPRSVPVQVMNLTDVVEVAVNGAHSVAVKSDGTVWNWGLIHNKTYPEKDEPVPVGGLTNVVSVAPFQYTSGTATRPSIWFTLALKSDGTVWTWGGKADPENVPVPVNGLTDIVDVAAGLQSSMAVKADGTLWVWGSNAEGKLGQGSVSQVDTPVQVAGLTDVTGVTSGGNQTLVLTRVGPCETRGKGDTNGDGVVDVRDVVLLLQVVVNLETLPDSCATSAADVNCDGVIQVGDAVLVLRNIVLGEAFPSCP